MRRFYFARQATLSDRTNRRSQASAPMTRVYGACITLIEDAFGGAPIAALF
jgi:hypothetical protein